LRQLRIAAMEGIDTLEREKADSQLPVTAPVLLVEQAEPGLRPVRPNRPLNMAIGVMGGLLASGVLTLLFACKRPLDGMASPA